MILSKRNQNYSINQIKIVEIVILVKKNFVIPGIIFYGDKKNIFFICDKTFAFVIMHVIIDL